MVTVRALALDVVQGEEVAGGVLAARRLTRVDQAVERVANDVAGKEAAGLLDQLVAQRLVIVLFCSPG